MPTGQALEATIAQSKLHHHWLTREPLYYPIAVLDGAITPNRDPRRMLYFPRHVSIWKMAETSASQYKL